MYSLNNFEKDLLTFSNRVDIVIGLEMGKKLSQDDAYREIKSLYKQLKKSRKIYKTNTDEQTDQC